MKTIEFALQERISEGMQFATERLVTGPSSPLLMGGTVGLVYFVDGPTQGFNFVSDFKPNDYYAEAGFPKELWLAFADYLETLVENIRAGKLDHFCTPLAEQLQSDVDGSA